MNVHEVGDIFVTIVEVVGEDTRRRKEDEGTCGDGLRGVPDVGLIGGVVSAAELRDAEEVLIEEALKRFRAILHRAHFDTSAHAVKNHCDDGVVLFPEDGAVFGVVGYLPNAGRSLDKGLVSVSVVLIAVY